MALTLKGARASVGLKQEEVAKLLSISTKTYIKKESNIDLFSLKDIKVLVEAFKLTKNEISQIFFKDKEE